MPLQTDLQPHALAMAARGWRVFPLHNPTETGCSCGRACDSPAKHPRTKHGCLDATTDEDQIVRWWAAWPTANIGLATGKESGVIIIDVDGQTGKEQLAELEGKHGKLPDTVSVATGGGGLHLYFVYPAAPVGNRGKVGGMPKVQVRGDGGYVVSPPSVHISGRPYEWAGESHEPAELPAAWLALISKPVGIIPPIIPPAIPTAEVPPEIHRKAVELCMGKPAAVSGQGGHGATYAVAVMLVWGLKIPADVALRLMLANYNPRCKPPWTEKDLRHKVDDAANKPHEEPYGWLIEPKDEDINWRGTPVATGGHDHQTTGHDQSGPKARTPRKLGHVSNVRYVKGAEDEKIAYCIPIETIAATLADATDQWPRRVGGMLFAADEPCDGLPRPGAMRFFAKHDELFAWMQLRLSGVHFPVMRGGKMAARDPSGRAVANPVSRPELFEHLRATASPSYVAAEVLPHEPPVPDIFYLPHKLPAPTGAALNELSEHLNPNSDMDQLCMLAALLTPGWGGPVGQRPGFVFASRHGRGVGKSKTAELFGMIWGGWINIDEDPKDWDKVKARLLSDDALAKRVVIIDNVKRRLSGQQMESLLSSPFIDGHRMYHGQFSRPNRLTFYLTANSPQASTDVADRCVPIQVGAARHAAKWWEWAQRFCQENRAAVISDIMARLAGPDKCEIADENADRWNCWQCGILAKFARGNDVAAFIRAARPEMDSESDDADEMLATIWNDLAIRGHTPDTEVIRISRIDLADTIRDAGLCAKDWGVQAITTWIRNLTVSPALKPFLFELKPHNGPRCWRWVGVNVVNIDTTVQVDAKPRPYKGR